VKVLLYGRLADGIGREIELPGPARTVSELRRLLIQSHPAAADALLHSRAIASDSVVGEDQRISDSDVIELLPPVCGG
jgi:molybdopterin converting factor small subunit